VVRRAGPEYFIRGFPFDLFDGPAPGCQGRGIGIYEAPVRDLAVFIADKLPEMDLFGDVVEEIACEIK